MFQTASSQTVAMPEGPAAFLMAEGPEMWHEFAIGLDFADPHATIDLLIACDRITCHPDCDRATAALILAKCAAAGFHRGEAPAAFDTRAARAFARQLTDALISGAFAQARFALPPGALRLILLQLGPGGPLPLPRLAFGRGAHHPHYAFAGWRPVPLRTEAQRAA